MDHLEELRWHVLRSLGVVIVVSIVVFVFRVYVVDTIVFGPYKTNFITNQYLEKVTNYVTELTGETPDPVETETEEEAIQPQKAEVTEWVRGLGSDGKAPFQALSPYEQFLRSITIALVGGVIVAFPYIAWEIWKFIKPGLTSKEVGKARGFVFFLSLLFFLGVSFGYFIISPLAVQFLANFQVSEMVTNQWRFAEAVTMIVRLALAAGLLFELPLLTYFLTRVGIISSDWMKKYRRHAAVVLLIVSAIITPPDWITQVLIFIPLAVLYEISIMVAKRVEKNEEKQRLEDEKLPPDPDPQPTSK